MYRSKGERRDYADRLEGGESSRRAFGALVKVNVDSGCGSQQSMCAPWRTRHLDVGFIHRKT